MDLIKLFKIIKKDNPGKIIHATEELSPGIIQVTVIVNNEYYELCQIDVKNRNISVNEFLIIYDGFTINKCKIMNLLPKKKRVVN